MKEKSLAVLAALIISCTAFSAWANDNTDDGSSVVTSDSLVTPTPADHGGPGGGGHGGPGDGGHGGPGGGGFPGHGGPGGEPGHGGPGHGGPGGFPGHGGHVFPVHGGGYPWHHWDRPNWARPVYGWEWGTVQTVTCTSVDSNGNYYPVTEDGWVGAYQEHIGEIEDASLDRCFSETNGDAGCNFVDCEPTY